MGQTHTDKFARLQVRELLALDALLRERSVSKAAAWVGVTQPTMSHLLARLRTTFEDPLLVRGRAGHVLTEYAEMLLESLRELVPKRDEEDDEMLRDYSKLLNRLSGLADEMSSYFRRLKHERESGK